MDASASMLNAVMVAADKATEKKRSFSLRYLGEPVLTAPTKSLFDASDIPFGLLDALTRVPPERLWAQCLGLAANQVGASLRLATAMFVDEESTAEAAKSKNPKDWTVRRRETLLINPRIIEASPETVTMVEGCLSIPHFRATLKRHPWVVLEYHNEAFERKRIKLVGMDAQIAQHETDHLDGKLITDNVPRQQRRQAERETLKFVEKLARRTK